MKQRHFFIGIPAEYGPSHICPRVIQKQSPFHWFQPIVSGYLLSACPEIFILDLLNGQTHTIYQLPTLELATIGHVRCLLPKSIFSLIQPPPPPPNLNCYYGVVGTAKYITSQLQPWSLGNHKLFNISIATMESRVL